MLRLRDVDAAEAGEVLGWEVVDSEDTDRQTGPSLEAEESAGLVEALVEVFHRG